MSGLVKNVADRLEMSGETGTPCPPIRDMIGETALETAYAVQKEVAARRMAAGRRVVGRKIGLTSYAVQRQLGVDQPDYGTLFDDMDVMIGGEIDWSRLIQPKIEAEIAFILGGDLDADRLTTADIIISIDWAVASLEIVDSRIENWNIRIADTIADNASSGLFVLGHEPRRLREFDAIGCGMVMERRGEVVSTGMGAACLGSPINAVLWLARTMASVGEPLRKGDVVLSGALGPMTVCAPGDAFSARIDGLGSVQIAFGGRT